MEKHAYKVVMQCTGHQRNYYSSMVSNAEAAMREAEWSTGFRAVSAERLDTYETQPFFEAL